MNAKKSIIAVSTIVAAITTLVLVTPASAEDHRGSRRDERPAAVARQATPPVAVVRHADYRSHAQSPRAVVERRVFRHQPPVAYSRPIVVQRPVYVQRPVIVQHSVVIERPVYVERTVYVDPPAPTYYPEQAPAYYSQPVTYAEDDRNPAGAIAGAVIGGAIGNQIGHGDARGIATVIGAIFGGLIGGNY